MQGADAIAEILRREGTEFLAVYPAQAMVDAAAKAGIRPIICRQERVGMAIADGFSRITNGKRIGVFSMQQGPGSENAFPGAAQAFSDNTPILLLPGGEYKEKAFVAPNFSPYDNYAHVTKWRAQINMVERIPELMRRAFYQLRTGKGGPVLLETPRDIWTEELPGELDYKPVFGNKTMPPPGGIREIAEALLEAERPVIYAGQGCLYAEAWDELQEIAELLQAPVTTTMPGKSAFPEDHPLALGASAVSHTKGTWHFLEKADLVFAIGTSLTKTTYGKSIPPGKTLIHSTADASDVNKDYQCDYSLLGDAKLTLRGLIDDIKRRTDGAGHRNTRDIAPEVAKIRQEWLDDWMPQLTSDEVPINQYRIIHDLQANVDAANTIITHDAGSPRDQLTPMWQCTAPRTYIGWGKSTQLGFGLGAIMGAKLAEPDKLCINIMGDAAIGMVGMDIETAVRNKIGILTIVFNNQIMAIERSHQPYSAESHDSLAHGGDYKAVAQGLGAWSEKVEKPDDFVPALKRAIAVTETGKPALLDCVVKEGYDFSKYE
ncbi:MAG: thiamine pyrophosphate-requiring protein [Dehalococcoidia bacterium]|nr:thiamine pyrophosphate-requiring protein [Dehalococcoidia bacterium]